MIMATVAPLDMWPFDWWIVILYFKLLVL